MGSVDAQWIIYGLRRIIHDDSVKLTDTPVERSILHFNRHSRKPYRNPEQYF